MPPRKRSAISVLGAMVDDALGLPTARRVLKGSAQLPRNALFLLLARAHDLPAARAVARFAACGGRDGAVFGPQG